MIGAPAATGWYVYGVVPVEAAPPAGVTLVEHGPVAAVAAPVSLEEFGEDALPVRLNDRAWLEEKARAHEAVLEAFVGVVPVVPLRFGAIYRDRADVERMLAERVDELTAALDRLRGRVELGVKAWFDLRRASRPAAAGGRAYLEQRRGELAGKREAAALAQAAHERLAAVAVDAVANRLQPAELSGRSEQMLLNGAYLVPDDDGSLAREAAALAAEGAPLGVTFELTGPWPPYNFVREEEPA